MASRNSPYFISDVLKSAERVLVWDFNLELNSGSTVILRKCSGKHYW